jgi:hypothetical protein
VIRQSPGVYFTGFVVALVFASAVLAAEHVARKRPGQEQQRLEQQIRAGRSVTKRIQRDPRASADVKQRAAELDQVLDARERIVAKLDAQYRDFLSRHKSELDEIEALRKQALAIDEKLGQAREALVEANRPDIEELKRESQRARELIEALRSAYQLDRRAERQH